MAGYTIQYHMHDGSDGGVIQDGFKSIKTARQWWKSYPHKNDFPSDECRVDIHEPDDERLGEAVEELN